MVSPNLPDFKLLGVRLLQIAGSSARHCRQQLVPGGWMEWWVGEGLKKIWQSTEFFSWHWISWVVFNEFFVRFENNHFVTWRFPQTSDLPTYDCFPRGWSLGTKSCLVLLPCHWNTHWTSRRFRTWTYRCGVGTPFRNRDGWAWVI